MTKPTKACVVSGRVPGADTLYAAVDPSARYVTPLPCSMRFAALLAPFPSGGNGGRGQPVTPFTTQRAAALDLLNKGDRLTRKAESFLGQLAVDPTPMSPAQQDWLATLLSRAGLPPLDGGAL